MVWSEWTPVARSTWRESQYRKRKIPFRVGHEEAQGLVQPVQPSEVQVAAIQDVEGPGLDDELIEDVHVVHPARRDEQHAGDIAPQVQQRVQLHGRLARAELGPGEQGQAQVDDRGVQRIRCLVQFDTEGLGRVEGPRPGDQPLGEVGEDSPVADLVGVGQRVAGDRVPEAHVVEFGLGQAEARLDVPQTLPVGELGVRQTEELVPAREALDLVVSLVTVQALAELVRRDEVQQLVRPLFMGHPLS